MALGPRDTRQLVNLAGWDAAALRNYALADGTTYAQVVDEMRAALGALNAELAADPFVSSIVSYTDQPDLEYRIGASNGFEQHTEYGRPDAKRADTTGHMLPLLGFDRALGWTWDYLQDARMSQVRADIADGIQDARNLVRVRILTRLLKRTDDSGALAGLGAAGYSPGFATAAASTNVDFTPPAYGGNTFTSDHEHYVGIAGGAFTAAVFTDAAAELKEHGHMPPFDAAIGASDIATVLGLTGVALPGNELMSRSLTTAYANVDPMLYRGVLGDFRIREIAGIPQYYGIFYKSYGPNSQRNPLKIRLARAQNALNVIAMPDPRAGNATTPIQYLQLYTRFGVGVADRTAATIRYVNNTTWADGTPS